MHIAHVTNRSPDLGFWSPRILILLRDMTQMASVQLVQLSLRLSIGVTLDVILGRVLAVRRTLTNFRRTRLFDMLDGLGIYRCRVSPRFTSAFVLRTGFVCA